MYQRILVPTDGSALSQKAAAGAIALAHSLGAEIVALHVVPRYPMSYFDGSAAVNQTEVARIERTWEEHGQAIGGAVQAEAEKSGVKARAVTIRSDLIADSIVAAAKKQECDLIVMASHGRKGLARMLIGSETQHVLTHGQIPVLVVR
jgi:nucleotide-binding universal stress UspA family protein